MAYTYNSTHKIPYNQSIRPTEFNLEKLIKFQRRIINFKLKKWDMFYRKNIESERNLFIDRLSTIIADINYLERVT